MKFEEATVGMEVMVTGEHADRFPEGAVIKEKDFTDNSIKITGKGTGVSLWFWDVNSRIPESHRNAYDIMDIYLADSFRKLPPTTKLLAGYLGLDAEKVRCFINREKGIIKVRQGSVEAKAKKAPQDKWDFRLGMGLALCRLKEKLAEHRKPQFGRTSYQVITKRVVTSINMGLSEDFLSDVITYAMGNVFHTEEEANANTQEMWKRTEMIVDFCQKQGW